MTADRAAFLLLVLLDDVKHKFWSFPSRLKTQIESELPLKARPSRFREPRFHGRRVGPVLFATKVRKRREGLSFGTFMLRQESRMRSVGMLEVQVFGNDTQ